MIDEATSNIYYYHYDGLGSVVALSNSSGNIVEQYEYDVFGKPNTTSSVGNPYLFTGRRYDVETELYYYRARYYYPYIGRFMSADPIGYADSMNLYTYVLNNPVNFIDPMGLDVSVFSWQYEVIIRDQGPRRLDPKFSLFNIDEVAFGMEGKLFPGVRDPYDGGFRHCVAACLLTREYGAVGTGLIWLWDMYAEWTEPETKKDKYTDMWAERVGQSVANDRSVSCEEGCLRAYPNDSGSGEKDSDKLNDCE